MLREAADQGHLNAQAFCGRVYALSEIGDASDSRIGLMYSEKAAQRGVSRSQFTVGMHYLQGFGCDQSYDRAVEWLEKAACQGNAGAMENLARLLLEGKGCGQSYERVGEWAEEAERCLVNPSSRLKLFHAVFMYSQKAASQGNVVAMRKLGKLLIRGPTLGNAVLNRTQMKITSACRSHLLIQF